MALETAVLLARIDQLLGTTLPTGDTQGIYAAVVEAMQGAVTIAQLLYGSEASPQVQSILKTAQQARDDDRAVSWAFLQIVWPTVQGSLRAMRADVEAGLIGNIERRAAGEVIADMLGLAKEALAEGTDGAKNVAAVLAAAAFEDTIRKMGTAFAGVTDRPPLADVIGALKAAGVLVGAPLTIALGYLKFRNDSLHADWAQLNAAAVASCLGFVEGLVLQHLS